MKTERLIGIIMILLRKDKVSSPELAKRFEVSRRTINRDIESLCKAGIPLVTFQGHGGGISIADNYRLNKTFLTKDELQSIFAGLGGMDSVSKTPQLSKLIDKLCTNENQITAKEAIVIDLASHYQEPLTKKIEEIKSAILSNHLITFNYCCEKGESHRLVEPYRLVFKWSAWYVFAYCIDRKDFRLFKLNRLWELSTCGDRFSPRTIPELEFDDYFQSPVFHLIALFENSEKHRLIDEYGVNSYVPQPGGKLLFERDFAIYEHMRQWIFSFGDSVKILAPEELKQDRLHMAQQILNDQK